MENSKLDLKQIIIYTGAIMAFTMGSGFATGQELLQYYCAHLYGMFGVGLFFALIMIWTNHLYAKAGRRNHFATGSDVYSYYCGPVIGNIFKFYSAVMCYMSMVVMVAGAASAFNQHFGIPLMGGAIIMTVLIIITAVFGLMNIVNVIGRIGPFMIILTFFVGLVCLINNGSHIGEGMALVRSGEVQLLKAGHHWLEAAVTYGGYCVPWFAAFMTDLAGQGKYREVRIAHPIAFIINTAVSLVVGVAMFGVIRQVADVQIPNLVLASMIWAPLGFVFAIVLIAAIYTSATPLLWNSAKIFVQDDSSSKYKIIVVILAVIGMIIAMFFPYNILMNYIYIFNGWIGFAFLLIMGARDIYFSRTGKYPPVVDMRSPESKSE